MYHIYAVAVWVSVLLVSKSTTTNKNNSSSDTCNRRYGHLLPHNMHRRERSRAERGDSGVGDRPHQLHRTLRSPLRLRRLPLHCSAENARCVGFVGVWILCTMLFCWGFGFGVCGFSLSFVCIIYSLNLFTPGFGGLISS